MNKPVENLQDDTLALRAALGAFATGVTVVTALAPNGRHIGLTVSSFNVVSLEPPLIVWSLALRSHSLLAFREADRYVVNVLALDQAELSQRFAMPQEDKFANLDLAYGLGGVPLLPGCCAWFECRNEAQYSGGDHLILIGQIERYVRTDKEPLIFHGGRYRTLRDL